MAWRIGAVALAVCAGAASGSAFVEVLLDDGNGETGKNVSLDISTDNTLIKVSVWLDRNGSTDGYFSSFHGWSNFGGSLAVGGPDNLFLVPVEGVTPGQTQSDTWQGRRPPAFPVPGGAGGGFRFAAQSDQKGVDGFGNQALVGIEGIQASAALGGFSQDTSDRVEVFRATIDMANTSAAVYEVAFVPTSFQVAITPDFNIQRAVFNDVEVRTAQIITALSLPEGTPILSVNIPAPGTLLAAGVSGLALRRRRAQ